MRLFGGMRTQWRVAAGMKLIYVGLDYAALPVVMKQLNLEQVPDQVELFDELLEMEQGALTHLNGIATQTHE